MSLPVLNLRARFVDAQGYLVAPWNSFFQQFTQAPSGVMNLVVDVSPYSYQVREPGSIIITGGTVSSVSLIRGQVEIVLSVIEIYPVSIGDIIRISYSSLPVVQFLPR